MTTEHPIVPPPELIQKWSEQFEAGRSLYAMFEDIYRAGADAELEACCEWLSVPCPSYGRELRNARRPKPLSSVAQAEALVECHEDGWCPSPAQWHVIRDGLAEGRRALEALPND